MRITQIRIENFRSIKELEIELGDTVVFIGPNNSGKTAILDALRIALTRRWGQRGTGFTEYDVHLANEGDDPKTCPGIAIEIRAEERRSGEWPDALLQDLEQIINLDPVSNLNSITLRVQCGWNPGEGCFEPSWTFLNPARHPLPGLSARRVNLEHFWQYVPTFYLGALRDADDEFSSRSQFWGRLLKAMNIPEPLEKRTQRVLDLLNNKLLRADPRLAQIAATLSGVTRVAAADREGGVDLRLVPLKGWDILSKAQIILRNEDNRPWLPLQNHGQGVQSLAVIFLFQAFVEHLLAELYEPDSSPVLALEEPETHLHPQAARTLWAHVRDLPGQKFITTHSPYFVQHVPLRGIRLVRLTGRGTEVRSLPASFNARIPLVAALDAVVRNSRGVLEYERAAQKLTVHGRLDESKYRELLTCYTSVEHRTAVHPALRKLRDDSKVFVTDEELHSIETFGLRIRGEIFFARRWLLVEGQCEYLIVHALAAAMNYDLDEHGVALIDAVNNGNPATFAVVARGFGIPWRAVFDGDDAGRAYVASIEARDFDASFVAERCATLSAGDIEDQFFADGLEPEMRSILREIGIPDADTIPAELVRDRLRNHKTEYAGILAQMLKLDAALAGRMPVAFRDAISSLRGLT